MTFKEISLRIKNLTIQGAENIAISAVDALAQVLSKTSDPKKIQHAYSELISLRATEPALRNALNYLLANHKKIKNPAEKVKKHFSDSQKLIAEYGAKKILSGMNVFTHCHSS